MTVEAEIKKQMVKYVELLTLSSEHQTAMFQKALDGTYTPDLYVADVSKCWADAVKAISTVGSGTISTLQAVANAKPKP